MDASKEPYRFTPERYKAQSIADALTVAANQAKQEGRNVTPEEIEQLKNAEYDFAPGSPVYTLEVPTITRRALFRREVSSYGARPVHESEIFALARKGIDEIVEESQRGELHECVDAQEAGDLDSIPKCREKLDALEVELRTHFQPYRAAMTDRSYWLEIAPIIATKLFLLGGENLPKGFKRSAAGLTEDTLALLQKDVTSIGYKLLSLMSLNKVEEKNSDSPSSSQ